MSLLYASAPLGQLVTGVSIDRFGLRPTYHAIAAIFVVLAIVIFALPVLRDLNNDRVKST
jgi:MFS family permease